MHLALVVVIVEAQARALVERLAQQSTQLLHRPRQGAQRIMPARIVRVKGTGSLHAMHAQTHATLLTESAQWPQALPTQPLLEKLGSRTICADIVIELDGTTIPTRFGEPWFVEPTIGTLLVSVVSGVLFIVVTDFTEDSLNLLLHFPL